MDQQIISALQQILAEGKQPSVATLKRRLTKSVGMLELISAVQQAKSSPESILAMPTRSPTETSACSEAPAAHPPSGEETTQIMAELRAIREELKWIRQHLEQQTPC
jgi:hypothetical protein